MTHILGLVEDEGCFSSMSFLKSKLRNRLNPRLQLVAMYEQIFFSLIFFLYAAAFESNVMRAMWSWLMWWQQMDGADTNNVLSLVFTTVASFGSAHFYFDTWVLFYKPLDMLFAISYILKQHVYLSVWQTGQGRGGYACISRSLSSSSAGQGRAGRPRQTPAHWTCWLYIGSLGKTGGPASNQTKIQFFKKLFSL